MKTIKKLNIFLALSVLSIMLFACKSSPPPSGSELYINNWQQIESLTASLDDANSGIYARYKNNSVAKVEFENKAKSSSVALAAPDLLSSKKLNSFNFSKRVDKNGQVVENSFVPDESYKNLNSGMLFKKDFINNVEYYCPTAPSYYYQYEEYYLNQEFAIDETYNSNQQLHNNKIIKITKNSDDSFVADVAVYPFNIVTLIDAAYGIYNNELYKINDSYDGTFSKIELEFPLYNRIYVSPLKNLSITKACFELRNESNYIKCTIDASGNVLYVDDFIFEVRIDTFDNYSSRIEEHFHFELYWNSFI